MNNNDKKMFSYTQLVQQLKHYCIEKRSGTMLIISKDSHSIRFVLNEGLIIACAFTMTQGSDALPLIKKIKGGSFSFVDGGFTGGMNINESPLPDTTTIFRFLEGGDPVSSHSSPRTASKTNNINVKSIIESIENELSQFVGPMAEFICEEYIEDNGTPTNSTDLETLVNTVALEIDDTNEREQFKQAATSKLH